MNTTLLIVVLIVFCGVFSQTVSGFGLGLIAMPVLSATIGLATARPLMAMVGLTMQLAMMIRMWRYLSFRKIGVMSLMGLAGIPLGVWLGGVAWLPESLLLTGLALLTLSYALYSLLSPDMLRLETDRAMGPFAFTSGLLSGAYNMGGPPIMIFADARRWSAAQVRSNLQGFFMFKSFTVLVVHAFSRNVTREVLGTYLWTIPAMAIGLGAGFALYGRINENRFRQIIQVLLVVVGVKLLFDIYIGG